MIQQGEVDLALGHFPETVTALLAAGRDATLRHARLYDTRYVCIMRRGHPLADRPLTLDAYCAAHHLLASATGRPQGYVDQALTALGRQRRVVMSVNQYFTAGRVVTQSDLLTRAAAGLPARHRARRRAAGARAALRPGRDAGQHAVAHAPRRRAGAPLAARARHARGWGAALAAARPAVGHNRPHGRQTHPHGSAAALGRSTLAGRGLQRRRGAAHRRAPGRRQPGGPRFARRGHGAALCQQLAGRRAAAQPARGHHQRQRRACSAWTRCAAWARAWPTRP